MAEGACDTESIESRLDAIEAQGARIYDAPACDCVRTLLDRAEELGGAVGARLRDRASAHLDALTERFARYKQRVGQKLAATEEVHGELIELRKRFERGELVSTARTIRRLQLRPIYVRNLRNPSGNEQPTGTSREQKNSHLSQRRKRAVAYEDSVAQLVAALALARATDVVPADAGPYNPLRIASEVLDRMREISPFYLAVQLNRLEELGSLLNLPELPPPPAPPQPEKKARSLGKAGKPAAKKR